MVTAAMPICVACRRFHPDDVPMACDAFLDGIPEEIYLGTLSHKTPVEGDYGLTFVLDTDTPPEVIDVLSDRFGKLE